MYTPNLIAKRHTLNPAFLRNILLVLFLSLVYLTSIASAHAQAWPSRTVTIVSPYPPGGTNDLIARALAQRLTEKFKQSFIVDNRPGAAGLVGTSSVMRSAPDGYTFVVGNNSSQIINSVIRRPSPYDPIKDFTAIAKVADAPMFIAVPSKLNVKDVKELIALAKSKPGALNYGTSGSKSYGNFTGEMFKQAAAVDITHVPFRGAAAALTELIGGRIDMMVDPVVVTQIKNENIKILATTAATRSATYPDIPTVKEAGGPSFDTMGWFGLFGPAGIPSEVTGKLNDALRSIMSEKAIQKLFMDGGLIPTYVETAELMQYLKNEVDRYRKTAQETKMDLE